VTRASYPARRPPRPTRAKASKPDSSGLALNEEHTHGFADERAENAGGASVVPKGSRNYLLSGPQGPSGLQRSIKPMS
jgi:hypothetical protein